MSELRKVLTELGWDQRLIDAVEEEPAITVHPTPSAGPTDVSYTDVTEIVYSGGKQNSHASIVYHVQAHG